MKKLILYSTIAATIIGISTAEYTIKYTIEPTPNSVNIVDWAGTSPSFTPWTEKGSNFDCSVWNPNENTITIGQSFQQSRDCSVNEERYRQERSLSETGKYRNEGSPILETKVSPRNETNQSIGTLETWISTSPTYSSWVNSGSIYGCSNWSPNPNTVTINQSFTQTATDCEQNQVRDRQDRETETTTNAIRNSGEVVVENQILSNITNTRTSTGTLETWIATSPTYTSWVNTSGAYSCSGWTPDPSTVNSGQYYVQTSNSCYVNQSRNRQNREVETTTGSVRNSGTAYAETQTIGGQYGEQGAYGTKIVAVYPTIHSFTASSIWSRGNCAYTGSGSWSVSNAVSYTLSNRKGTYSVNSSNWSSTNGYTGFNGNWSLTACSSTGHCSTSTISVSNSGGTSCK